MPIRDVFLPLVGQPRGPAVAVIEKCVATAADLGARITVLALAEAVFERPKVTLAGSRRSFEGAWGPCLVRNHERRRQLDRQGTGKLGEFPWHRCDRDGRLASFAPE